jgi:hypothetical protein
MAKAASGSFGALRQPTGTNDFRGVSDFFVSGERFGDRNHAFGLSRLMINFCPSSSNHAG